MKEFSCTLKWNFMKYDKSKRKCLCA
jgi:hypothetical protein